MNFLAHSYLAGPTPQSLVGNMVADFVKGRAVHELSPEVRRGVFLHRQVDRFTDSHAVVKRSCARLDPINRRFAGIITDIFYDHFLAAHWPLHSYTLLEQHAESVYRTLEANRHLAPSTFHPILDILRRENWLCGYATRTGVETTLRRMGRRITRGESLPLAMTDLDREYDAFHQDFEEFFSDLLGNLPHLHLSAARLAEP